MNESSPNFYCANGGDGRFSDIRWESGGEVKEHGEPEDSVGLTLGNYNNDVRLGIFVTNLVEQSETPPRTTGTTIFSTKRLAWVSIRLVSTTGAGGRSSSTSTTTAGSTYSSPMAIPTST